MDEDSHSPSGLTLGGILSIKQTPPYRITDRTLLDLIRDDQSYGTESRNTWKMLRKKLRLKLVGTGCNSAVPTITSLVSDHRSSGVDSLASPVIVSTSRVISDTQTDAPEVMSGNGESSAARMSLMSLFEVDGSSYRDDEVEDDDDVENVVTVEEGGGGGGGCGYNNCCVCMVRHKGAAFIPCGHTFCRLCSRELFVKRASCPLCNHFILEILDIF